MAKSPATLTLRLYRALSWAVTPFVGLLLSKRLKRGKEDATRLRERYGHAGVERPKGALVWVHGASVGEMLAVLPLMDRLRARGFRVLLTSGTVTSARLAATRLPADMIHQYVPLDSPVFLRRFLKHWRPDLVLLAEAELWPNLMLEVKALGVPLLLVNARMSQRSFGRWHRLPRSAAALLSRVDLCLAQGEGDGDRLRRLGAPRVTVTGNLKFDTPPPPVDAGAFEALRAAVHGRPVLVAASTHAGEEEEVVGAHKLLQGDIADLITVIAPRHPERGREVLGIATEQGVPAVLRSDGYLPDRGTGIYVADTIGELGLFYRLSRVAFLGGSLVRHGGQNPIEPARLDAALLHGPHVANFGELYERLDQTGGAALVVDAESLADHARVLFADAAVRSDMLEAARETLDGFGGALERTLAFVDPYLVQIRLERH
ncbi:MAG TPA: 3-deoxy-D-manno-octulosonic acid transferase [Xanthobacteraceae bacterium]|nr:3-deoxy-D-manno-octulosonic acid transferase [Xanthobacteraceae bacterium]